MFKVNFTEEEWNFLVKYWQNMIDAIKVDIYSKEEDWKIFEEDIQKLKKREADDGLLNTVAITIENDYKDTIEDEFGNKGVIIAESIFKKITNKNLDWRID